MLNLNKRPDIPPDADMISTSPCIKSYIRLLKMCWLRDPLQRPDFSEVTAELTTLLGQVQKQILSAVGYRALLGCSDNALHISISRSIDVGLFHMYRVVLFAKIRKITHGKWGKTCFDLRCQCALSPLIDC